MTWHSTVLTSAQSCAANGETVDCSRDFGSIAGDSDIAGPGVSSILPMLDNVTDNPGCVGIYHSSSRYADNQFMFVSCPVFRVSFEEAYLQKRERAS